MVFVSSRFNLCVFEFFFQRVIFLMLIRHLFVVVDVFCLQHSASSLSLIMTSFYLEFDGAATSIWNLHVHSGTISQ